MFDRPSRYLCTTAIVEEKVGAASARAGDKTRTGKTHNGGTNSSWAGQTLEGDEIGSDTSNVGASHRSTRDGIAGAVASNPGRSDARAWGEDVKGSAEVAVGGTGAGGGDGTDSKSRGSGGWGEVGSVGIVVTGGNDEGHTGTDGIVHGSVESSREATTQAHAGNCQGSQLHVVL